MFANKIKVTINKYWFTVLLVIIFVHIFLLSKLIFFPYPELFIYSYLTQKGLLPYKDILDQHFPGIMFFPINLATLGIDTPSEARILHLGVVVIIHLLLFKVTKKLFRSNLKSLISNLLYLVWQPFFEGYVLWVDTFIPIFLLASFFFVMDKRKKSDSFFLSGIFLGVALTFKQPVILIFLPLSVYLYFNGKSSSFYKFLMGFSIPLVLMLIFIFSIGAWEDFIYWTITFNLTVFAEMGRKYPTLADIFRIMPVFGFASLSLIYFIFKKNSEMIVLLTIYFLGSLSFAFARFDYVHLQPAIPFALILIAFAFKKLKARYLITTFLIYTGCMLILILPFYRYYNRKVTLFYGEFEKKLVAEIRTLTKPGDSIFAMGTTLHIYQMTDRLPPGKNFVFQFPWFMKVAEDKVLAGVLIDPPKVVIRDESAQVSGMNLVSYMPKIDSYVDKFYMPIKKIEGVEILVRK